MTRRPGVPSPYGRPRSGIPASWRGGLTLGLSTLLVLVLWDTVLAWPWKILVVLFHECGHAFAALVTGGKVMELSVNPWQGGHTLAAGGSRFLTLNGGYLGSLLAGVALLAGVRRPKAARGAAVLLGGVLTLAALLWVPVVSFGFVFTVLAAAGFLVLGRRSDPHLAMVVVRTLGVFSVLYAFVDIRDDVFGAPAGAVTDATLLAQYTGLPAPLWGLLWLGAGAGVLWKMRRSLV